jgi:hypothetical protein
MFNSTYGNMTSCTASSARRITMSNMLPNLLVVGVPKAGTSSLFSYLGQHPDICPSKTKEIGYFSPLGRGQNLPPAGETYQREFEHWSGQRYRLEATPAYCYGSSTRAIPTYCERIIAGIQSMLEQPKIILSLREPIDRLWSDYTFQRAKGNLGNVRNFDDYLHLCRERRRQGPAWQGDRHYGGLSVGFYDEYVGKWLEAFGEDVRVVFTDDLSGDPLQVLHELCGWLAIDADVVKTLDVDARNKTMHVRNTKLARWVYATKRVADRLLRKSPSLRDGLRSAYLRLNAGDLVETLHPSTRSWLEETYRESNRRTAAALAAHGYHQLPAWLTTD